MKYDTIHYNTKAMIEGVAVEGHHPSHHLYLTSPTHLKSLPAACGTTYHRQLNRDTFESPNFRPLLTQSSLPNTLVIQHLWLNLLDDVWVSTAQVRLIIITTIINGSNRPSTNNEKTKLKPRVEMNTSCMILQPLHDPSWLNNVASSSSVTPGSRLPT